MMERYEFVIFGGAEFNTSIGHFLVYDVPSTVGWSLDRELLLKRLTALEGEIRNSPAIPIHRLDSRLTRMMDLEIRDLVRLVHAAGGAVVWAHPMDDWSLLRKWFNKFSEDEGTTDMAAFAGWLGENDATIWWPDMIRDPRWLRDSQRLRQAPGRLQPAGRASRCRVWETRHCWQRCALARGRRAGSDQIRRRAARDMRIGELMRTANPTAIVLKPVPVRELIAQAKTTLPKRPICCSTAAAA